MTEDQNKLLSVFEARVRQLMFLCDDLKRDNNDLKIKLDDLNKSYNILLEENKTLKIKYDNLKMAKIISVGQDDFKSAKTRLSKLVREVDKCIALLNE
jgi:predicted nuclease with TOPRIM domain